jgi:hypothetical protein
MVPSLLVIFFVGCMVWMWANQGLFSAFIHLILTIIAGVVALAFWEPFVYGFLINRMPEQAWGMGLIIPFGMILLALRTVFDKMVPGNLNFNPLVDTIGGGALGFVSGVLTAGLLLIGVQMVGLSSVAGYQGYEVSESGEVVDKQKLLIPVDRIASGFFVMLSGGSMNPILHDRDLTQYHPNLAREASLYHQSPFWTQGLESTYRALPPINVKLVEPDGYSILSDVPPSLAANQVAKDPGRRIVVVGVNTALQDAQTKSVAADAGGIFRIARSQIALAAQDERGDLGLFYPIGWIQDAEYRAFTAAETWAYSGSAANVVHNWVFQIPASHRPSYLTLKNTRVILPAPGEANTEVAKVEELFIGGTVADGGGEETGPPAIDTEAGPFDTVAVISPSLVVRMNINRIDRLKNNIISKSGRNCLSSGEGRYLPGKDDRGYLAENLSVSVICHADSQRVVRINMGNRQKPGSLIGKVFQFAGQLATPVLKTAKGNEYQAIGYVRRAGAATFYKIDPSNKISRLAELNLPNVSATDEVFLFFHVDVGEIVTSFELKNVPSSREALDLEVK